MATSNKVTHPRRSTDNAVFAAFDLFWYTDKHEEQTPDTNIVFVEPGNQY